MKKIFEKWEENMDNLPEELRNDKEFISYATKEAFYYFREASDKLKDDKDYVFNLLKENTDIFADISDKLKDDKDFIKKLFENKIDSFGLLDNISDKLKDDKELALLALKESGSDISYFSDRLKDDIELAKIALDDSTYNINYLSDKIKDNKDFILNYLKKDPYFIYSEISDRLKDNKEFALIAVSERGDVLQFASDKIKNDKDVVIAAYKNDKDALQYASEELMLNKSLFPDGAELTLAKRIENKIQNIVDENGFTEEFTGEDFLGNVEILDEGISIQHATGRLAFALFENDDLEKILLQFESNIKETLIDDEEEYEDDPDCRAYPDYSYEVEDPDEDDDEVYDNLDEILDRGSYNSKKSYATLYYQNDYISVEEIAWGEFENPVAFETTEIFKSMVLYDKSQIEERAYTTLKYIVLLDEFPELING